MLTVKYKQSNTALEYSLDILLNEFLGLEYTFVTSHSSDVIEITQENLPATLSLNADFFKKIEDNWLKKESMPARPLQQWQINNDLEVDLIEQTIPILYGQSGLTKTDKQNWHLNLDIFGSAFFMLSRYEELIIKTHDDHNRFPASSSIAHQENFLNRPIIDEYTEILWTCLSSLWPNLQRKKYTAKTFISCDVDQPFDCTVSTFKRMVRTCSADLIKRKSPITAIKRLNRYIFNKIGNYKLDPCYTFDWYMDTCEKHNLQVTFFFIPDSSEPNNGCYNIYDKKIIDLIKKILDRKHLIGIHGSYNTYDNPQKLLRQKQLLENILKKEKIETRIEGNRQHYLRWDSIQTPAHLEEAGFNYDSTGSYFDHAGFKYGTSHEFSMWNWLSSSKTNLKQRPLIAMECSIFSAKNMGLNYSPATLAYIKMLKSNAIKYQGNFTLLWHNSHLTTVQDRAFFKEIVKWN